MAKEDQPHYLKVMARPDADTAPLVEYGLGVISARTRNGGRNDHGVIAPVRTYEAPIDRRLEEAGFGVESTLTLLHEGDRGPRRRAGARPGHPVMDPIPQGRHR